MSSAPILSRRRLLFGVEAIASPVSVARTQTVDLPDIAASGGLAVIAAAQCLNARGVVCASCADACPHRAIMIPLRQRDAIHVIPDRCDGCGDCLGVCPSHAVALQQPSLESA